MSINQEVSHGLSESPQLSEHHDSKQTAFNEDAEGAENLTDSDKKMQQKKILDLFEDDLRFPMSLDINLEDKQNFMKGENQNDLDDFDSDDHEEQPKENINPKRLYTKLTVENDLLIKSDPGFTEYTRAAKTILQILNLRDKYITPKSEYALIPDLVEMQAPPSSEPTINYFKEERIPKKLDNVDIKDINGVYMLFREGELISPVKSMKEYLTDLQQLLRESHERSVKSLCYRRICLLGEKFNMHLLFNRENEFFEQKVNIHRDFYNIRKVDTFIEHTTAVSVKTFLEFVEKKGNDEWNIPAIYDKKREQTLTLEQVFEKCKLKSQVITIENLEVRPYLESFRAYARSSYYSQFSTGFRIGEIFLNRENLVKGRFLAELTHELFQEYQEYKFQFSELRTLFYGKSKQEWSQLADWFYTYKIYNHHVRWVIQIPRIYHLLKSDKIIKNFQELLDNIFKPLFDVTINPESDPKLHKFLLTVKIFNNCHITNMKVVGFDTIDDEAGFTHTSTLSIFGVTPSQWTSEENPHFCYWVYYLWANIYTLNTLRKKRELNTFSFRPHVGESGSLERIMSAYLLSDGISQGSLLNKSPMLEYLFYLKQIPIAMSPLSDNKSTLKYKDNPFPKFFARGLNVSIATDRPLLYHMTSRPLIEEYSVAAQVFDLNSCDLCELAQNSVLQSGFEDILKAYWLGENYKSRMAPEGNDVRKTNVPQTRYLYRIETLTNEFIDLKVIAEASHS